MAERGTKAQTQGARNEERGFVSKTLGLCTRIVVGLILAVVLAIVLEWIGMTWWWPDQGARHSQLVLNAELEHLGHFGRNLLVDRPTRIARDIADGAREFLLVKSGIEEGLRRLRANRKGSTLDEGMSWLGEKLAPYIDAAATVAQSFAIRLCVLALSLPAYAILGLAAFADGLVERDLRRCGGGRESSFVYHWSKGLMGLSLGLPWIVYLSLPISIHPNWVVLPCALLFALVVKITTSSFKKYL